MDAAARRLWLSLEALHAVVYFAPAVRSRGIALGLKGFWMTYFAFRAAPLGRVDAPPVVAAFAGFHPDMVARALPDAWTRVSPDVCVEERARVAAEALRECGVDVDASRSAVELLAPVAASADPTGRPLFAANAAVPLPEDPVAALWQLTSTLREHRGDGHVAALVAASLSGLDAHLLQVSTGRFPAEAIRTARGWSEQEWTQAADRLRARGLLAGADAAPELSAAGRAVLDDVEQRTDRASWDGALTPLGTAGVDEVVALLEPSVSAVWASGVLPAVNPIGLRAG